MTRRPPSFARSCAARRAKWRGTTWRGAASASAAWDEFDLGFAPREWQALSDTLLGHGAKAAELVALGLIKPRSGEGGRRSPERQAAGTTTRCATGWCSPSAASSGA